MVQRSRGVESSLQPLHSLGRLPVLLGTPSRLYPSLAVRSSSPQQGRTAKTIKRGAPPSFLTKTALHLTQQRAALLRARGDNVLESLLQVLIEIDLFSSIMLCDAEFIRDGYLQKKISQIRGEGGCNSYSKARTTDLDGRFSKVLLPFSQQSSLTVRGHFMHESNTVSIPESCWVGRRRLCAIFSNFIAEKSRLDRKAIAFPTHICPRTSTK
jgi:hypothetical protein